jgi:phosphoglycolate phosphatase-like HAD superfamily hydrolase
VDPGRRLRAGAHLHRRDRTARRRAGGAATNARLTVVLDFDGTLVDVHERHYDTYRSTTEALGGRPLDPGGYWERKRRGQGWAGILAASRIAATDEQRFVERFVAGIEAPERLRLDRLFPGAREALTALRRGGDRLVLLSLRRSATGLERQLEWLGITGEFDRVRSGHSRASGRHDKVRLIRELGIGPPAAAVGDTEADVLAARELGLPAIAVASGLRDRSYLERLGADLVLDGIAQVPEALATIRVAGTPWRAGV